MGFLGFRNIYYAVIKYFSGESTLWPFVFVAIGSCQSWALVIMATGSCQGNASGGWLRRSCPALTQLLPGWPSQRKTPPFSMFVWVSSTHSAAARPRLLRALLHNADCWQVLAAWKAIACVSDTTAKPSGKSSSAAACRVDIVKDTEAHFPPRLWRRAQRRWGGGY